MSKHTPGPWELRDTPGTGLEIYAKIEERLELTERQTPGLKPRLIWQLLGYKPWRQFPTKEFDEVQRANGRLMVAAPKLLETLKAVVDEYAETIDACSVECAHEDCRIVNNARAAIAEAGPQ